MNIKAIMKGCKINVRADVEYFANNLDGPESRGVGLAFQFMGKHFVIGIPVNAAFELGKQLQEKAISTGSTYPAWNQAPETLLDEGEG